MNCFVWFDEVAGIVSFADRLDLAVSSHMNEYPILDEALPKSNKYLPSTKSISCGLDPFKQN